MFYRDSAGAPRLARRPDVPALFESGAITDETPVFDTSIGNARDWRDAFVRPAGQTWVASLRRSQASQSSSRSATNSSSVRKG